MNRSDPTAAEGSPLKRIAGRRSRLALLSCTCLSAFDALVALAGYPLPPPTSQGALLAA